MQYDDLIKILQVGLKAVSPYNLQPWKFQYQHGRLTVIPYFRESGFLGNDRNVILYSLGALLENIKEGAKHCQYDLAYRILTDEVVPDKPLCEITFIARENMPAYDISHVMARCTNRKKYRSDPLPKGLIEDVRAVYEGPGRRVFDVTGNNDFIDHCAQLESIRFSNVELTEELLKALCFTPQEAEKRRSGLDLRTLELTWLEKAVLFLARHTSLRRYLGRGRLERMLAESNMARELLNCPLLLVFTEDITNTARTIEDWMHIQHILNDLQRRGLSSHIMATAPDLIRAKRSFYVPQDRGTLDIAQQVIEDILGIKASSTMIMLRVGFASPCKFRSLRKDPRGLLTFSPDAAGTQG